MSLHREGLGETGNDRVRCCNNANRLASATDISYLLHWLECGYAILEANCWKQQISSNGSRVVYRSGGKFIAATIATARGASVTAREELFEGRYVSRFGHPQYDVNRTGSSFVLLQPVGNPEIVVVLNGLERLVSLAERN